jgi:hypothetical protein
LGVIAAKLRQTASGIKQARVKKIRTYAARLQSEFPKTQYTDFQGELDKFLLVFFHADPEVLPTQHILKVSQC